MRDQQKLAHTQDMLKTRKMVHLSYVNELKRLSCEESKQEEQQVLKTEESKATLKDAGLKKKKTVRKKSKEPVHKYDNAFAPGDGSGGFIEVGSSVHEATGEPMLRLRIG